MLCRIICTSLACELEISRSLMPVTSSFYLCKSFGMQSVLHDTHSWLNIYQIFIQLLSGLIIEQASTELSFFLLRLILCCSVDICSGEAGQ